MARYFVDIDGTLTDNPSGPWGKARRLAIKRVKQLIRAGNYVVVWSARGESYARAFCQKYGIQPNACHGKPDYIVDDNPEIRSVPHMRHISPEELEGWSP